jgi:hypothetical protein
MTNSQAKTLQIFLPTGEPRGIRIAEVTTRIVQAVLIPRSELAEAKKRPECGQVAVYMLFGEPEESAKPMVYIGQTEDPRKRLDWHNSNKDFWRTAVLGISKTQNFTSSHIQYLEWLCLQKAKEVNRFTLDNDQSVCKPFVTEPMEADLLDTFETLATLVSALGYPVFEPIIKAETAEKFYCHGKDADAVGEFVEDGFVVRKGSIARLDMVPSAGETVNSVRTKLQQSGVLAEQDGHLRFTQDYLFSSPSGAAAVVMGRTANGWIEWKDAEGQTLHDVKRGTEQELNQAAE